MPGITESGTVGVDHEAAGQLSPRRTSPIQGRPPLIWPVAQAVVFIAFAAVVVLLFARPETGLTLLFGIAIPLLPLTFLIAPGLWRNVCPLASANQLPRTLRISRRLHPPKWLYSYGYPIAMALFFGLVCARPAGLDRNGPVMGAVLLVVLLAAFIGGLAFKGKSGWCSTVCPLLPLERAYGRTPLITFGNAHCRPCLGCTKNCYDRKPANAYTADLSDRARSWRVPRELFAAVLPGFVVGFFTIATHAGQPLAGRYLGFGLCVLAGVALFGALSTFASTTTLTAVYTGVALNLFYWFGGPVFTAALARILGVNVDWLRWPLSATVLAATVWWASRTAGVNRRVSRR
ncbi:hypothetical protein [Nocardia sp. NBC_00511]|uniref:hypothetical protein n=1 Tax=Nocardia sp. NBC_00511 TaxID=2903591 RepID=UPI0030E21B66